MSSYRTPKYVMPYRTIKKIEHGSLPGDIRIMRYRPSLKARIFGFFKRPISKHEWTFEILTPEGWIEYDELEHWDNVYKRHGIDHPHSHLIDDWYALVMRDSFYV